MKNLRYIIGIILFMLLIFVIFTVKNVKSDLTILLPDVVNGWEVAEKDQIYNCKNLYDYIDGGAELYLSYGFEKVIHRIYSKPEQPDIVVDIFDMGTSQNAFGVFAHSRETVDITFGQGSQYTPGFLLFWKYRYYVSILASPETAGSKEAVFSLAGKIDDAIEKEGPLPEILSLLPQESLVEESIRYFHHYIWLNSYYFVADENILHIDENTDAILAKYGEKKKRSILLLVEYQNDKEAKLAYDDFVKYYLPELSKEYVVQIEDGTWTACQLTDNLLIAVFSAPEKTKAINLMDSVQERLSSSSKTI